MSFEIGDSHLTACDKRRYGTEYPECDGNSCTELDHPTDERQWIMQLLPPAQNAKQLLCSMAAEKKPHNNAHK